MRRGRVDYSYEESESTEKEGREHSDDDQATVSHRI